MDFGHYIKTIRKAKVFKENTLGIVQIFFEKADSVIDITDATANGWVYPRSDKGGPPEHFRAYFPHDTIDESQLLKFFRQELHGNKWKKLQDAFSGAEHDSLVDCKMENQETFIFSLLSQFKALLHLHPCDENTNESHNGLCNDGIFNNSSINSEISGCDIQSISKHSEELLEKFIRAVVKHDIVKCINQGSRGYKDKFLKVLKDALDIYSSNSNEDEKSISEYIFLLINNFYNVFDDYIDLSKSDDYDIAIEVQNQRLQLTDILRAICRNHEVSREFYPALDLEQTLEIISRDYKIKSQGS